MYSRVDISSFPSSVTVIAAIIVKEEEVRSRSSTNSSLEFIDDYFGDADIKKEWEVRTILQGPRQLTANYLKVGDLLPWFDFTRDLFLLSLQTEE